MNVDTDGVTAWVEMTESTTSAGKSASAEICWATRTSLDRIEAIMPTNTASKASAGVTRPWATNQCALPTSSKTASVAKRRTPTTYTAKNSHEIATAGSHADNAFPTRISRSVAGVDSRGS